MEIKDYVSAALRTESHTPEVVYQRFADNPDLQAELNTAVSIFIDAAQRLDKIKKHLFYGKPVEFSASAVETEVPIGFCTLRDDNEMSRVLHAIFGMCTEAGEMLESLDKVLYENQALDVANMFEEMGDSMWYFALGCDAMQFDPGAILARNIDKLRARYPDKFSSEAALNRDLDKEKQALQG